MPDPTDQNTTFRSRREAAAAAGDEDAIRLVNALKARDADEAKTEAEKAAPVAAKAVEAAQNKSAAK